MKTSGKIFRVAHCRSQETGGTEHPMVLYKRFRGQEPTVDALLERSGLN